MRDRIASVLWFVAGWGVHCHTPSQGAGLDCPERLVDGESRGDCYWQMADAVIAEIAISGKDPVTIILAEAITTGRLRWTIDKDAK